MLWNLKEKQHLPLDLPAWSHFGRRFLLTVYINSLLTSKACWEVCGLSIGRIFSIGQFLSIFQSSSMIQFVLMTLQRNDGRHKKKRKSGSDESFLSRISKEVKNQFRFLLPVFRARVKDIHLSPLNTLLVPIISKRDVSEIGFLLPSNRGGGSAFGREKWTLFSVVKTYSSRL